MKDHQWQIDETPKPEPEDEKRTPEQDLNRALQKCAALLEIPDPTNLASAVPDKVNDMNWYTKFLEGKIAELRKEIEQKEQEKEPVIDVSPKLTEILCSEAYKACQNGTATATQKDVVRYDITKWRDVLTGKTDASAPSEDACTPEALYPNIDALAYRLEVLEERHNALAEKVRTELPFY